MKKQREIEPDTPVFVAVGQFWLQQIRQIEKQMDLLQQQGADKAADQVEAIHDLRVAVRRSQSLALAFSPYIPGKWPERIRHELRPLRKACEALRDLDVLACWLSEAAPKTPGLHAVLNQVHSQQAEALADVLQELFDKQNLSMLKRLKHKLELDLATAQQVNDSPGTSVQLLYRLADVAVPVLLARAADLTAWRMIWLKAAGTSKQTAQTEILHQLRIAGKHFRYTLDFLSPIIPELNPDLAQSFAEIQTVLGDLHDRMQFQARLLSWPDHRTLSPVFANQLAATLEREEDALSQRLVPLLAELTPGWFQTNLLRPSLGPGHSPV